MEDLLKLDYELCANINEAGELYDITIGSKGMCQLKKYSPVIFHTHPTVSKPYPSFEDLNKVAKHTVIRKSIILTIWGKWSIIKLDGYKRNLDKNIVKKFTDYMYELYRYVSPGRQGVKLFRAIEKFNEGYLHNNGIHLEL